MNINWDNVADTIFGILKGNGAHLKMLNSERKPTLDPHDTVKFIAQFKSKDPELKSYLVVVDIHNENNETHIDLKTPKLKNAKDLDMVSNIKNSLQKSVKDKEGPTINWSRFDKVITPKPEVSYESIAESKDISKVYGTTKSSFQRVGECKIIIRHTDTVDESKQGSRWRKIRAVFVETKDGERFKYPFNEVAGPRALARHLSEGGSAHDEIGESIKKLSSDYMDLKRGSRLLRRAGDEKNRQVIREISKHLHKKIKRLSGPRGYASLAESLKNQIVNEDSDNVLNVYKSFMEGCGCTDQEGSDAKALLVVARHLTEWSSPEFINSEITFTKTPDIISKASEFTDQKKRMAWQIRELADCMGQSALKPHLKGLAIDIEDNRRIDPSDIELIRRVFIASMKQNDSEPVTEADTAEDTTIDRIRTLSGL